MTGKEKHIITTFIGSLIRFLLTLLCRITASKRLLSLSSLHLSEDGRKRGGISLLSGITVTKKLFTPLWGRLGGGLLLLSVTAMAQTPVEIPNPDWPLDSVINGSVHKFTVQGDSAYDQPSRFVWNVEGGRLFFEEELISMAGDGVTDTVPGNANNATTMWVVWDSFTTPLDTGYVYVHEISAAGCERFDDDPGKYQGMRIKVSAPPDVLFPERYTETCSYESGVNVPIVIEGMPPFDLIYKIDGEEFEKHIVQDDLLFKGDTSYINIFIDEYVGATEDIEIYLELIEASSGGVKGSLLQYREHTVHAYRRPASTVIRPDWIQITQGELHTVYLEELGESPATYLWDIYRVDNSELVYSEESGIDAFKDITFNFEPGSYYILSQYISENGCMSLPDTLEIEMYGVPVISFTGEDYIGCSESSIVPNEFIEFGVNYEGALTYSFTYVIYDYNDNEVHREPLENITSNEFDIQIENTFINDALPQQDREWKIVILENSAENEEGVGILVKDGERIITIHPKPIVHEDIDFAN
jgi:hypothetical protein